MSPGQALGPTGQPIEPNCSPLRAAGPSVIPKRLRMTPSSSSVRSRKRGNPFGDQGPASEPGVTGNVDEAPSTFKPNSPYRLDSNVELKRACVRNQESATGDARFTLNQVRRIVESALADREKQLREEYDAMLLERLDEQWRTFAKFNEDHVHKKMTESKHDYYL